MLERFRGSWRALIAPVARGLVRLGLTPDAVTWTGTVVTIAVALVCLPNGWLWQGALALGLLVLTDSIDGSMARLLGRKSRWGAFLDSTLDRLADGAIFAGLTLYYAGPGDSVLWSGMALGALVTGQVTSYAKARGESVGVQVSGGLATRADRLVIALVGALLTGLGLTLALPVALCYLLVAGSVTVGQRMWQVYRADQPGEGAAPTRRPRVGPRGRGDRRR